MKMNVYRQNGYADREDYLSCIAEDYGYDLETIVRPLAELLGPNEDFDGLVSALEDLLEP
ncbi:MAG: RNA polymerase [Desulfurellales bacterium]|nr:MAG: RNA polymerase [Desulfurellales bacterium]